jgi:hypothetical protein
VCQNIRRPTSGRSHVQYGVAGENLSLGHGSLVLRIEARLARIEVTGERLPTAALKLSYR